MNRETKMKPRKEKEVLTQNARQATKPTARNECSQ